MTEELHPEARPRPPFPLGAPTDAEFVASGTQIAKYLYRCFPRLRGLGQRAPHFDPALGRTTDPVEHTIEVIGRLDTTGLDPGDRKALRAAAVFHDIGKVIDPLDPRHARKSAELCALLLEDFDLLPPERDAVIVLVALHDALGQVAAGRLATADAASLLGTPRLLELAYRLTRADVASIRGLVGAPARIETAYHAVGALLGNG